MNVLGFFFLFRLAMITDDQHMLVAARNVSFFCFLLISRTARVSLPLALATEKKEKCVD